MARPHLITGLDIGTNEIKALVAQKNANGELESVGLFREPTFAIRRGVVIDVQGVSQTLNKIQKDIQASLGQTIASVYVNIGGSHIFCTPSHGTVSVSRADDKVSEEDINRVLEAARTFSLSSKNKEILEAFPRYFVVDGEKVKEAVGMKGIRLEVDTLVVCVFSPYYQNLQQSVLNSGLHIQDVIPSAMASARAVLSPRQKELGVALLDIGAGTSSLAVYEEGNLIHLAVLPIGSANITNDIAIGFKTDIDVAEKIKKEYGSCVVTKKEGREKIEVAEPEPLVSSRKSLVKIIEARVSEIFEQANKELKNIEKEALLPAGVVLTGGGPKLPKMIDIAKKEFNLPCKIGKPRGLLNIERDPSLSTVCGLVLLGFDAEEETPPSWLGEAGSRIRGFLRNLIP